MSHYALTLAIAGIQTRKPRKEILPVLHGLQNVLVIMQEKLDHAIRNPAILIGVPADETNQIFREYQPCLEHEYPSCNGKLYEECDQAFMENPEAWLDEVYRAREFIRRTTHESRVKTQQRIVRHTTTNILIWLTDFGEPITTTETFEVDLSNWTPQIPQIPQIPQNPQNPQTPEVLEVP